MEGREIPILNLKLSSDRATFILIIASALIILGVIPLLFIGTLRESPELGAFKYVLFKLGSRYLNRCCFFSVAIFPHLLIDIFPHILEIFHELVLPRHEQSEEHKEELAQTGPVFPAHLPLPNDLEFPFFTDNITLEEAAILEPELIAVALRVHFIDDRVLRIAHRMQCDLESSSLLSTRSFNRHFWLIYNLPKASNTVPYQKLVNAECPEVPLRVWPFRNNYIKKRYKGFKEPWYHPDMILTMFHKLHPEYTHIWALENDVALVGLSWEQFFDEPDRYGSEVDLIGAIDHFYALDRWPWTKSAPNIPRSLRRGTAVYILRVSRRLNWILDRYYARDALPGFCELIVPSVALGNGLRWRKYEGITQEAGVVAAVGPIGAEEIFRKMQNAIRNNLTGFFHPIKHS